MKKSRDLLDRIFPDKTASEKDTIIRVVLLFNNFENDNHMDKEKLNEYGKLMEYELKRVLEQEDS